MYRACELKDQTYKKTRTLQFSELVRSSDPATKHSRWVLEVEASGATCEGDLATFGLVEEVAAVPIRRRRRP